MGNNASIEPYGDEVYYDGNVAANDLDAPVSPRVALKPKPVDVEIFSVKPDPEVEESSRHNIQKLEVVQRESSEMQEDKQEQYDSKDKRDSQLSTEYADAKRKSIASKLAQQAEEVKEEDDMKLTDILFQFIPYYGQGNSSNDSTVRAALSGLDIEDIDARDEYGNTLLLLGCTYRCEDLVRIMINKGADPNAVNSTGACCLHFACYGESASFSTTKLLLKNGANPEVSETTYGCTPLHYCASSGNMEFCKLLLSYGAQINTYDYYNYTCVDYAREAGASELEKMLQQRLDAYNKQFQRTSAFDSFGGTEEKKDLHGWLQHQDYTSGNYYYTFPATGECLWESDWRIKMQEEFPAPKHEEPKTPEAPLPTKAVPPQPAQSSAASEQNQAWLVAQATRTRLIAFLSKHDPAKLVELESMLERYKGREQAMLKELCVKYNVSEDPEFAAFQAKLNELQSETVSEKVAGLTISTGQAPSSSSSSGVSASPTAGKRPTTAARNRPTTASRQGHAGGAGGSGGGGIDPVAMQAMLAEERAKFEVRLAEEKAEEKGKFEAKLGEDRTTFRVGLAAKDGIISELQAEIGSLKTAKQLLEVELKGTQERLERAQSLGGAALSTAEGELSALRDEITSLRSQLSSTKEELQLKVDNIKSLEDTLASLTSGHEETIAREKAAAVERERQAREKDAQHRKALQDAEDQHKAQEQKWKSDMTKARSEWKLREEELKDNHDQVRRAKDIEIESLKRELAERKSKFAQDLAAMSMELEQNKQIAANAVQRAETAEATQKSMENEIVEARAVQQFNAQLHKDLAREQIARKRLHNEMEDLKGRIRVYVRVRPMSKTELERGCSEAVTKDGKISVLVKGTGPDGKKNFDFDQVFGGSDGNTQTDIFRDTKHLMMSVLDGYNVCIFAYGQTGAGKSFTMIGGGDIGTCLKENGDFDESAGITPRAVSEIFRLLNERSAQMTFTVDVQMFQLYRDGLEDLLYERKKKKKGGHSDDDASNGGGPLKITLAEHSSTGLVQVEGAVTLSAETPADVMRIFAAGSGRRTTTSTLMNAESSRSHLICSLVVKMTNRRSESVTVGKLTLVDLAGSERIDKSGAEGDVMKEAQSINKSLSALGDVIAALTSGGQKHIPYRNHPLTMLMSDSIGGNAKTLMFVNTSPADYNVPETVSSLGFASRCKDITNSVSAGPGAGAAQISALKKELAKLKKGGPPGKAGLGGSQLLRPG